MTKPVVLITGAGGFVGGWMAEALHLSGWAFVRAGVSRWSSAARIARFPVEIVQCDVTNQSSLDEALRGVDMVIHCARGKGNDNSVTEEGTRLLLERAAAAGVQRLVYMSSVAVYGEAQGIVREDTPVAGELSVYGSGKLRAEAICASFATPGFRVSVIRPTLIYGPFSEQWTLPYIARFASGKWRRLGAAGEGRCNLVYVGDLVRLTQFVLTADLAPYEVFNGNGPETPTWNEYLETFNEMLGMPPLQPPSENLGLSVELSRPVRELGKYMMAHHRKLVLAVADRSPYIKSSLRKLEADLRLQPTREDVELYALDVTYSMDRAASVGFRPQTSMRDGLQMTVEWARDMGIAA